MGGARAKRAATRTGTFAICMYSTQKPTVTETQLTILGLLQDELQSRLKKTLGRQEEEMPPTRLSKDGRDRAPRLSPHARVHR